MEESTIITWDDINLDSNNIKNNISISDALVLSLNLYGNVNMKYISEKTNKNLQEIIDNLKGSIYLNPDKFKGDISEGWETKDEYLSGDLLKKWKAAQEANKTYNNLFYDNLMAIRSLGKKLIPFENVYITLGTPWIPAEIIKRFIFYLLDIDVRYFRYKLVTYHQEFNEWKVDKTLLNRTSNHTKNTKKFGTEKISAVEILEHTLNMKSIRVNDKTVNTITGKQQIVFNEEETILALKKQEDIISLFRNWITRDDKRVSELRDIYSKKFVLFQKRNYDGSFLFCPGLNKYIKLFDYQKNAIARILFSPNTLIAHDVGVGKTYIMIIAGMELRRLGISKKNVYVVPNNLVGQWRDTFLLLYKNVNLLTIEPKDFTKDKKHSTLKKVKENDYDAIIIPYSCFDRIEFSYKQKAEFVNEDLIKNKNSYKRFYKQTEKLEETYKKLLKESQDNSISDEIYFDDLGINTLFLDEAHNYKNIPLNCNKMIRVISSADSQKSKDMLDKVLFIQSRNMGRGVVFATATPITNSLSDLFVMQKYLQNSLLKQLGLDDFNAWLANFAEVVTDAEIDINTTNYKMVERFSKFHNLPELTTIFSMVADFHEIEKKDLPQFDGYSNCFIEPTDEFNEFLLDISKRADIVRSHNVSCLQDNMLKITTDARMAALDLRLVKKQTELDRTKVFACAKNVYEIYMKNYDKKATQVIFCDTSVPKKEFNIYDELKRILVGFGVKENEIAFVHDANSLNERNKLFDDINNAKVKIVIGSTYKLGTGVNIQKHLFALHHIDIPWRPADMEQREGRILRFGNQNKKINIYRYITTKSFDAYSWQLLEIKEKIIRDVLSGMISERNQIDVGEQVLSYAEVKSLALGQVLMKKNVNLKIKFPN